MVLNFITEKEMLTKVLYELTSLFYFVSFITS